MYYVCNITSIGMNVHINCSKINDYFCSCITALYRLLWVRTAILC